jgi:tRNA (Thr-GGU) A37 N-methylase
MGKRKDSSGAALVGLATAVAYILYLRNKVLQRQVKKLNSERKDPKRKQGSSTATSTATSKNNSTSTTDYVMKEIGIISSPYPQRAGCPRQGLLAMSSRSILTLDDSIAKECLDDLEEYSHVWVIFQFHLNPIGKGKDKNAERNQKSNKHTSKSTGNVSQGDGSSTKFTASKIKPPRAGGRKVGVLATRSPHRPNNVGISLAMVEEVTTMNVVGAKNKIRKKTIVKLKGLDLVDGTPVYDLKPYLPLDIVPMEMLKTPSWVSADDQLSAVEWSDEARSNVLQCQRSGLLEPLYPAKSEEGNDEVINAISEIVSQDPRAQHEGRGHDTQEMSTYAITFSTLRVKFQVKSLMGEKQHAVILEVVPDEGDISAQPGSYQHSVGIRRKAEVEALEKGLNLIWKYPVREGVTSGLFKLRDGSTHKYGTKKC